MAGTIEPVDAVIISGTRRGEIVRLPSALPAVTDEDIQMLNAALDEVIAAVARVAAEVRATTDALKERPEAANGG